MPTQYCQLPMQIYAHIFFTRLQERKFSPVLESTDYYAHSYHDGPLVAASKTLQKPNTSQPLNGVGAGPKKRLLK